MMKALCHCRPNVDESIANKCLTSNAASVEVMQ